MDRQLLERMIGAAVLVVLLILIVPAILTGPEQLSAPDAPATGGTNNLRQLTIRPDDDAPAPPVSRVAAAPKEPAAGRDPGPAPQPALTPVAKPDSEPKSEAEPKPAPTVAKAPDEPPAAAPKAAARKQVAKPEPSPGQEAGWVVQLGSFASRPNAEGLASKVKAAGYQSYLVPLDRNGKTLYRVRVGPPDDQRSKAEQLAGRLARAGYRGQVTRQEAGG